MQSRRPWPEPRLLQAAFLPQLTNLGRHIQHAPSGLGPHGVRLRWRDWVPNHNNGELGCMWKVAAMVMVCTGTFPFSLWRFRTDSGLCGYSFFVVVSISGFQPPLHLPAPFSMNGGLLLAYALNSTRFRFAGVVPFGGVKVGLGIGFSIDDGMLVPSDAHLHHAGVLCVPHLWLL